MRWHHKQPPKKGDTRIRTAFLWQPKQIGHESRWLERARWREEVREVYIGFGLTAPEWVETGWVDNG